MLGEIRNTQGERIDYTFHEGRPSSQRVLVIGHGVTGNKDRPFLVALSKSLESVGIATLRFSFSGNGASEGRFVNSTISKEVGDLGSVLDAVVSRGFEPGYLGHSMGGAVGVVRTSSDSRIKWLISLAGMVHTKAFAEREFGALVPGEGLMWDSLGCPLSQEFMDDAAKVDTVVYKAAWIKVPWLLVHGSEDDVVPITDSRDILARAGAGTSIVQLDGANHVFAGEVSTAAMISVVTDWLKARGW